MDSSLPVWNIFLFISSQRTSLMLPRETFQHLHFSVYFAPQLLCRPPVISRALPSSGRVPSSFHLGICPSHRVKKCPWVHDLFLIRSQFLHFSSPHLGWLVIALPRPCQIGSDWSRGQERARPRSKQKSSKRKDTKNQLTERSKLQKGTKNSSLPWWVFPFFR